MTCVTEVRLLSYYRRTVVDDASNAPNDPQNQRKKKAKKRKRTQDKHEEQNDALFEAAQNAFAQELQAAGISTGDLPLSFGTTQPSSKKRKRTPSAEQPPVQITEKVHVKYDSDGEITERHVEPVVPVNDAQQKEDEATNDVQPNEKDAPTAASTTDDRSEPNEVQQNEQETANQSSETQPEATTASSSESNTVTVHTPKPGRERPSADSDVYRFWKQRYHLFYRYDDGILMDIEGWFSVTPQAIAEYLATRCACDVVVDPFAGCGGNVIQLAKTCRHVIAIDIDPTKIEMARHNAKIYGVDDRIEWIVGDSLQILPTLKADVVFLSPPWGGCNYDRNCFRLRDMKMGSHNGVDLFALARQVTKNIAYYVPRTTSQDDLQDLVKKDADDERFECQHIYLNHRLKVVTAYYGDLATTTNES